jgi:transposase
MSSDMLDRLACYRPTNETISSEWPAAERAALRNAILNEAAQRPMRFRPRRPRGLMVLAPVAASAAVLAIVGAIVLVHAITGPDRLTGGDPTHFTQVALSNDPGAEPHDYVHEITEAFQVGNDGTRVGALDRSEVYVAGNGDVIELSSSPPGACTIFKHSGDPNPNNATAGYLAGLPTDPDKLASYLLDHVQGSSSKDEAVFVAVGDMLRHFDGFASPRLRAALVDVLSRSHLITVHRGVRDYQNRPAVRVDFMDQARRPGQLASLYFDATTFQLVESRYGSNGQPGPGPGPSFPYTATPANPASTSPSLTGPANIALVTTEEVVHRLPDDATGCTVDNG